MEGDTKNLSWYLTLEKRFKEKVMIKLKIVLILCFVFSFVFVFSKATVRPTYYILEATGNENGFFSCFHTVTGFLDFYEKNKNNCAGIEINFTQGLYLDSQIGQIGGNIFLSR